MMSEKIIEIKNLKKHFGQLEVLHSINFDVSAGEVVCLIGASGSGKFPFSSATSFLFSIGRYTMW